MKTIIRLTFLFIFGLFSIQLTSCGNDKPNKVEFKEDTTENDKTKKDKKKFASPAWDAIQVLLGISKT